LAHRSFQAWGISPTKHAQHVTNTFALSYNRLDSDDPTDTLALALLARTAYFAPGQPIPAIYCGLHWMGTVIRRRPWRPMTD
jgi:hypothetical protein